MPRLYDWIDIMTQYGNEIDAAIEPLRLIGLTGMPAMNGKSLGSTEGRMIRGGIMNGRNDGRDEGSVAIEFSR